MPVVVNEDEHDQLGTKTPREGVVERQLFDLAGVGHPESGRRDLQFGQFSGGERFEPDLELVRDGHFPGLYERIADHGDVTALCGLSGRRRLAIQEPQAVGPRHGPDVTSVRPAYFRAGRPGEADARDEPAGLHRMHERFRQPEPRFPAGRDQRQSREEKQHVPADCSRRRQQPAEQPVSPHSVIPVRRRARRRGCWPPSSFPRGRRTRTTARRCRPAGTSPTRGGSRFRDRPP